ncbi:MAG: hypothetical protein IH611_08425, partial [Deltaproteobacteria bacterium]|nr:hypothetical protein [Deltaproteobacteria bacterium]
MISVLLLVGALVPYFTFWGCGSGGYDEPSATAASTLLTPETLASWINSGKVNSTGYERVVLVDVTTPASYNAGHIPGAQCLDSGTELMQTRIEGVAPSVNMVPEGSRMDALIQRLGIDANTTIVFTSKTSILSATRAYFTFRYWGFPKERLKVLDGGYAAWTGALDNVVPTVTPSTYSVRDLGALNAGLRASLGEMMAVAADTDADTVILDTRSGELAGGYAGVIGSTTGVFPPGGDYAAFEGHMKGGRALAYSTLSSGGRFLPNDNLVTLFAAVGVDGTKT